MQTAGLRIGKAADGVTARCSNYGEPRTAVAALGPQRTAGWGRDMQAGRNDGFYVPEVPATRLPELFVVDGDVTQTLRNEHALEQSAVENYPPPRIHWPIVSSSFRCVPHASSPGPSPASSAASRRFP